MDAQASVHKHPQSTARTLKPALTTTIAFTYPAIVPKHQHSCTRPQSCCIRYHHIQVLTRQLVLPRRVALLLKPILHTLRTSIYADVHQVGTHQTGACNAWCLGINLIASSNV